MTGKRTPDKLKWKRKHERSHQPSDLFRIPCMSKDCLHFASKTGIAFSFKTQDAQTSTIPNALFSFPFSLASEKGRYLISDNEMITASVVSHWTWKYLLWKSGLWYKGKSHVGRRNANSWGVLKKHYDGFTWNLLYKAQSFIWRMRTNYIVEHVTRFILKSVCCEQLHLKC